MYQQLIMFSPTIFVHFVVYILDFLQADNSTHWALLDSHMLTEAVGNISAK